MHTLEDADPQLEHSYAEKETQFLTYLSYLFIVLLLLLLVSL